VIKVDVHSAFAASLKLIRDCFAIWLVMKSAKNRIVLIDTNQPDSKRPLINFKLAEQAE